MLVEVRPRSSRAKNEQPEKTRWRRCAHETPTGSAQVPAFPDARTAADFVRQRPRQRARGMAMLDSITDYPPQPGDQSIGVDPTMTEDLTTRRFVHVTLHGLRNRRRRASMVDPCCCASPTRNCTEAYLVAIVGISVVTALAGFLVLFYATVVPGYWDGTLSPRLCTAACIDSSFCLQQLSSLLAFLAVGYWALAYWADGSFSTSAGSPFKASCGLLYADHILYDGVR